MNVRLSLQLVPDELAEKPLYDLSMSRHVKLSVA